MAIFFDEGQGSNKISLNIFDKTLLKNFLGRKRLA
jgi:hypothetical protein